MVLWGTNMAVRGMYKPYKYRWGEAFRPFQSTNIIQFWLSILSFSVAIFAYLYQFVARWWGIFGIDLPYTFTTLPNTIPQLSKVTVLDWVFGVFGTLALLAGLFAFIAIVVVLVRGATGTIMEYVPGTLPPEIEKAIEPIKPRRKKNDIALQETLTYAAQSMQKVSGSVERSNAQTLALLKQIHGELSKLRERAEKSDKPVQ